MIVRESGVGGPGPMLWMLLIAVAVAVWIGLSVAWQADDPVRRLLESGCAG